LYKIFLEPYMPRRATILAIVVGVIIGLIWAYAVAPIVFYDADPRTLDQTWQDEWVRLIYDRYAAANASGVTTPDFDTSIVTLLRSVDNPQQIAQNVGIADQDFLALAQQAEPGAPAPQPSTVASIVPFIVAPLVAAIVALILILLWGILIYPNIVQPILKRLGIIKVQETDEATKRTMEALRAARDAEAKARETPPVVSEFGEPVTRRMSVYIMGRGQFDDSFEIEDNNEMFLGECGATIAETVGTGEPEKVTAVEVWLFDKDDFVRTMTNVFLSEYAYNDPAIRSKLETKGDIVLAKPGAIAILETNSLRMQARIVDMTYGTGDLPPNSYLERLTLELSVWQKKDGASVPALAAAPVAVTIPQPYTPTPTPSATPNPMPTAPSFAPPPPATLPGQQAAPLPPRPAPRQDDDPFGGTGDFTPVN
jgi:hypothetical protein